jgi:hypothetical protein
MSDEPGYQMVMPFVVCQSQGGPYEDRSFVAGVQAGSLDHSLSTGPSPTAVYLHPDLVPQADLLAMRHGYSLTTEPWVERPDEWVLCTFMIMSGG